MNNIREVVEGQIKLFKKLIDLAMYPREWRKGQAVFNMSEIYLPEYANQLRATEYDCFYNEKKITIYLEKLYELMLKDTVSIIDIEREAFEAGRENGHHIIEGFYNWDYDTFEDYLKSKELNNINSDEINADIQISLNKQYEQY